MELGLLPTLNNQLLRLDRSYGADMLAMDFVQALHDTLEGYEGDRRPVELMIELLNLYDLLLACRPRMANLILAVQKVVFLIHQNPDTSVERMQRKLRQIILLQRMRTQRSVKVASGLFEGPKTLLIHSLSGSIISLLEYLKEHGNRPKIVLAAQAPDKTNRLVKQLAQQNYKYTVVSEYSVSQIRREVDLAIFGGLTLNDSGQVVMGPGSGGLVAQLNQYGIPNYVIVTVNKFSYWKEPIAPAFREVRSKVLNSVEYQKFVFSHDTVPLDLFTGLISQRAIHTPDEARELFREGQQEFFAQEAVIRDLNPGSR